MAWTLWLFVWQPGGPWPASPGFARACSIIWVWDFRSFIWQWGGSRPRIIRRMCELCDRSFGSQKALSKHLRYSSAHFQLPKTPLNMFFQSFDGFKFDPNLSPSESYSSLQRFYGWHKGDKDSDQAWDQYQEALTQEFKLWFGAEDDIAAWHSLCRAVRIEPLPRSCLECEKVVYYTQLS